MQTYALPKDLGRVELSVEECMYYLYLPIRRPESEQFRLPDARLHFVRRLLLAIEMEDELDGKFVYLTVKRMYVGGGVTANRPGWHIDGYGSNDINYVWYDCVPTIFSGPIETQLSDDHTKCLEQLEAAHPHLTERSRCYPNKHLLRLDPTVIHRVDTDVPEQLMRTFVKITISDDEFNLAGNSLNPLLPSTIRMVDREARRNSPVNAMSDRVKE